MQENIDMSVEVWKNISGYERIYQISNFGRIKRLSGYYCKKEKILKPWKTSEYGHLAVALCKNRKIKYCKIHRLVLEAFVGSCPPGMQCRHLDGNPANNRLDNLKWGTPKENMYDRKIHGKEIVPNLNGEKCGMAKLNERQVRIIKWLFINSDMTDSEIAEIFMVSRRAINSIRNNKTWKHVGVAGDKNG